MANGYMGKILRINLSEGKIEEENLRQDWAQKFIGGAGLATRYLYDEVPPGADPLGPENKLIFMTGPLTGTLSASAARYSVVAKSPLTGIWGHGNSGGDSNATLPGTNTSCGSPMKSSSMHPSCTRHRQIRPNGAAS